MHPWAVALAITVPSAIAGVLLRSALADFDYRRDDELQLPRRATWWLPPAVLAAALIAGVSVSRTSSPVAVATFVVAAWVMVVLAFIDLDVHRLPNRIQLPSYPILGVLLAACSLATGDWFAFARALGCGAGLWLFYFVLALMPSGFGFGDVKLAGLLGMLLGWLGVGPVVTSTFVTFIAGGLVAAGALITRRANRKTEFAYGPYMLIGALAAIALATPTL